MAEKGYRKCYEIVSAWPGIQGPPPHLTLKYQTASPVLRDALRLPEYRHLCRHSFVDMHWKILRFWIHVKSNIRISKSSSRLGELVTCIPVLVSAERFIAALEDRETANRLSQVRTNPFAKWIRVFSQNPLVLKALFRATSRSYIPWILTSTYLLFESPVVFRRILLERLRTILGAIQSLRSAKNILTSFVYRVMAYPVPISVIKQCMYITQKYISGNIEPLLHTTAFQYVKISPSCMEWIAARIPIKSMVRKYMSPVPQAEIYRRILATNTIAYRIGAYLKEANQRIANFAIFWIYVHRKTRVERLCVKPILENFAILASYRWRKMKRSECCVCYETAATMQPMHGDLRHAICGTCREQVVQCPLCRIPLVPLHEDIRNMSPIPFEEEDGYLGYDWDDWS
jgi:hypothetical protein